MPPRRDSDPFVQETDEILFRIIIEQGGLEVVVGKRKRLYTALDVYNRNNADGVQRFGTKVTSPTKRRSTIRDVLNRMYWGNSDNWGPTPYYINKLHLYGLVDKSIIGREQDPRSTSTTPHSTGTSRRSTRLPPRPPVGSPGAGPPTPQGSVRYPDSPGLLSLGNIPASPLRGVLTNMSSQGSVDSDTIAHLTLGIAEDELKLRHDCLQAIYAREENAAFRTEESVVNNFIEKGHESFQTLNKQWHQSVVALSSKTSQTTKAIADQRVAATQHRDDSLEILANMRSALKLPSANNDPPIDDDEAKPAAVPQRDGEAGANENDNGHEEEGDGGATDQVVASPVARARVRGREDSDSEEEEPVRKTARTWSWSSIYGS